MSKNRKEPIGAGEQGQGGICPTCGGLLPAGGLAGLCPACLLSQAEETEAAGVRRSFQPPSISELAAVFPRLEIQELIGVGGMGAVYRARQPELDRGVALKILAMRDEGGAGFSERFNREARALARLSHPNIVAVHEFGQAGGLSYFIMEYVDGTHLRQLEKRGRLSPREALQIIPQICDALQYAHDSGVVHRDIKPENVLLDRRGRVKIADFGLAKILGLEGEGSRLTLDGQVMGTPHYMAPEQVERPLAVDHRADIYSLGVVFYEMLTGDLPLGKFPPPSRKVEVDVRLDDVVLRALENDPERRYQRVSEVKSEVESLTTTPATAVRAEDPAPAPKPEWATTWWTRLAVEVDAEGRRRVNWAGLAAGVLGLVVLLAVGLRVLPAVQEWLGPGLAGVAVRDRATGVLSVAVPGGGRVELLAVSDPDPALDGWWRPDGQPVPDEQYEVGVLGAFATPEAEARKNLVLRMRDLPTGASGPRIDFGSGTRYRGGGEVRLDGRPLTGGHPLVVEFPAGARTATMRVGLEWDPWQTLAAHDPKQKNPTPMWHPANRSAQAMVHSAVENHEGSAELTLIRAWDPGSLEARRWRTRVVAVDRDGAEHSDNSEVGTPAGGALAVTHTFGGLPLAAVAEFRVQVRPVHWFEFRQIALRPSQPVPPSQPPAFGPVVEREFDEVIDWDTGRTAQFPSRPPGGHLFEGLGEEILWMQENGFDAFAGTGELHTLDTVFAALDNEDWETLRPSQLFERWHRGQFHPRVLQPFPEGQLPSTFAFRTREGGMGVLQLVGFHGDRPGARVRFKLVKRPTAGRSVAVDF
jgi:hypothetical protein